MRTWIDLMEGRDEPMLSLDPWSFDQTRAGWRMLPPDQQGTMLKSYISNYVANGKFNENTPTGSKQISPSILIWHLGQVLAMEGKYPEAVEWMRKSKEPDDQEWNDYVDATIAFIMKDRKAFDRAAATPGNNNADSIERLKNSWGQHYRDAY